MPTCKKIYPNCIWTVPPEWHGLNFYSALLTRVYWNYATDIIRVCVTAILPTTHKPIATRKSNIQIHSGSKAMGRLHELLCHHSMQFANPLVDELLCYLPTPFHSLTFDKRVCERSNDEAHHSNSNISAFYSDDSN